MGGSSPTTTDTEASAFSSADDKATFSRLLAMKVTPTAELAAISSRAGLGDSATRSQAWPKLLALNVTRPDTRAGLFEGRATALNSREGNQVELDVRRSHWIPAAEGPEARETLSRVIKGVLASHPGECRYYQGLHDIAAVLVLVCGESASAVLDRLVVGHLRDAVRGGGLDQVLETLKLLPHLIAVADPELHAAVFPASTWSAFAEARSKENSPRSVDKNGTATSDGTSEKVSMCSTSDSEDSDGFEILTVADFSDMTHIGGCHFAVPWFLTWFAHSLSDLSDVSRLFDVFIANDPLMPLYVGAAAIVADRDALLAMARGETDEMGNVVDRSNSSQGSSPNKNRGLHRVDDWPIVEGMLHARLSTLPPLASERSSSMGKQSGDHTKKKVVRVLLRVVETASESDGGFRSSVQVSLSVVSEASAKRVEKANPAWGVEPVIAAALALHARLPPRALFTVIGQEPDPFSAYAAYPYPWLAMNRWGFGEGKAGGDDQGEGIENSGNTTDTHMDASGSLNTTGSSFRLGQGASATALFAQRLGANIRRGVQKAQTELKKTTLSSNDVGLGAVGASLAGMWSGTRNKTSDVPRLNDD